MDRRTSSELKSFVECVGLAASALVEVIHECQTFARGGRSNINEEEKEIAMIDAEKEMAKRESERLEKIVSIYYSGTIKIP